MHRTVSAERTVADPGLHPAVLPMLQGVVNKAVSDRVSTSQCAEQCIFSLV